MVELDFSKSLILEFQKYIDNTDSAFVIDEESGMDMVEECIGRLKECDKDAKIYAVTYPQTQQGVIYSDNILIRTALDKSALVDIFSMHSEVEPYYIEVMTDEEKESAEWIDLRKEDFSDEKFKVFSLYWD